MSKVEHETGQARPTTPAGGAGYRSGVAARLAGLSAATLRVWERRYHLTATERSATGQRLYSTVQVRRLGVLKQLVDQGHAIGTVASLPDERLLDMLDAGASVGTGPGAAEGPGQHVLLDVAAIGAGLVQRLAGAIDAGLPLRLHGSAASLAHAGALTAPATAASVVLLIELPEPDGTELEALLEARARAGAAAAVVLYRFCSSATVRTLRARGFLVARFPAELGELPLLCRAALQRRGGLVAPPASPRARGGSTAAAFAPPRFDEMTLAAICQGGKRPPDAGRREKGSGAGISNADAGTGHDGARMLAEMLLQVGSFERYSARCAQGGDSTDSDTMLHRHLELVSAEARLLLEAAMDRLLRQRR